MALLEQSLQRPNALRRLRFPALKSSSRSCRISGAGNDARGLPGVLNAMLSAAGGVGQAFSPLAAWVAFWCPPFSALFLRPFGLPLLAALGRVKEISRVPPITRVCGGTNGLRQFAYCAVGLSPRGRG